MQHVITAKNIETLQQQTLQLDKTASENLIRKTLTWCHKEEENRFLWLGIAFLGTIGMILPLTLLAILFASGNNFTLWIITCIVNVPVLVVNLAAQPTKVTLPILFTAWLINGLVVIYSLSVYILS